MLFNIFDFVLNKLKITFCRILKCDEEISHKWWRNIVSTKSFVFQLYGTGGDSKSDEKLPLNDSERNEEEKFIY